MLQELERQGTELFSPIARKPAINVLLGELKELSHSLPPLLKEAQGRSDFYMETYLRTLGAHRVFLAADEPQRARQEAEQAIAKWSHQGFHFPHYWVVVVQVATALYCGEGVKAW